MVSRARELRAGYALLPEVGVVGSVLTYPDGALQHAGVVVGMRGWRGTLTWTREVSAVTVACLLLRRELYDAVDGSDELVAISGADVELYLRVGKRVLATVWVAGTGLRDQESFSRYGLAISARDFEARARGLPRAPRRRRPVLQFERLDEIDRGGPLSRR